MTDFKTFEKKVKIYEQIKALDAEIISLERLAERIAGDECEEMVSLRMSVGKEEAGTVFPVADLYSTMMRRMFMPEMEIIAPKPEPPKTVAPCEYKNEISPYAALKILAVLLTEKNIQRNALIEKL